MRSLNLLPTGINLRPNSARVLIRPFISGDTARVVNIIGRALALSEAEIEEQLIAVTEDFGSRHLNLRTFWRRHFERVKHHVFSGRPISEARQLYIGALFSGEYALESAALFNPSIVPHPDQTGLSKDELRFIMSLRATGEGHIFVHRISHRHHPRRRHDRHGGALAISSPRQCKIRIRNFAKSYSSTS